MAATENQPTELVFHHSAKAYTLNTEITSIRPFSDLEEANRQIFKTADAGEDYVICTKSTIYHPQGGGQPSDEGTMVAEGTGAEFIVKAVRMDSVNAGQVLHLGKFANGGSAKPSPGGEVVQKIDVEKRLLYSRLHTAGHVLGAAVRHLLEDQIAGFDELKASHFPDSAACEFQGSIEGKWKEPIQAKLDEYIDRDMEVEIDFWSEEDFAKNGLSRLLPDRQLLLPGEDRFRVVKIKGAEVYPCGGTHVDTTKQCGRTTVKKIARSKGTSRVSYTVA